MSELDLRIVRRALDAAGLGPVYWERKRLLETFFSIEVPVIAAVNGLATVHADSADADGRD